VDTSGSISQSDLAGFLAELGMGETWAQ
jgi:hypothetical protein